MQFDESVHGNVTVLTVHGDVTAEKGGDVQLRDRVHSLLQAGRRQIVLDLSGVAYVDSAGNGVFVQLWATTTRSFGGRMVLCNLIKRLKDLWTICQILSLFATYDSPEDAVRSFTSVTFDVSCPVCRPASWMPLVAGLRSVTCAVCGGVFNPAIAASARLDPASIESPTAIVTEVSWPTYGESPGRYEHVHLTLSQSFPTKEPTTLQVYGRLDRFVLDVTEMAWRTVPPPRRVLFDLTKVSNSSERARTQLEELCGSRDEDNRAVILVPSSESHLWRGPTAYADRERAVSALGSLGHERLFVVSLRRRLESVGPA